ncbi:MAG: TatD family hydrolase [Bacteroidales bacterium]|jgi:TatD DNase family protein|nr:TatD family hydrolase [Bacteroidales bacterium]MCI1785198.1 TatD family hydrolase [Bacteroidales bacterium]
MYFIDTHTHNYDTAYSGEEDEVISRAVAAGVTKLIQPDIDSKERDRMFSLTAKHKGVLFPMLGLYPGSVDKEWEKEIEKMLDYKDENIVAIGEIGLDFHFSRQYEKEQKRAFKAQLELADKMDLPVNIHERDAWDVFFSVMEECRHLNIRGNIHAFGGSIETFERLQKYGDWYVGIGGTVTFKKASVAESIKKIPLDRILLETDSPYLTPAPHRGTRNESSYIPVIAARIAELKETDIGEIAVRTTENAEKLFGI